MDALSIITWIDNSLLYAAMLGFFALYPMVTSIMWITTSMFFRWRQENATTMPLDMATTYTPKVSILIAAHNEEAVIEASLKAAHAIDYPDFEIVVVDDGSTDQTANIVARYHESHGVRLIRKIINEGKAMALNDALPCLRGEIVLILDADAEPEPQALRYMVRHFESARVAAVTGNPRVKNATTLLSRLQLMEFTSIVSLLRRSQRVWGRILTVSGVVSAFRKDAILDVGGFSPEMPTEDIELTWKLQKRFYDVRYEPNAVIWMIVPEKLRGLYKQRLRWAHGLMQVLRKHYDIMLHWKYRRMWPVYVESVLSVVWAVCFVALTLLWGVSFSLGHTPIGANPLPNIWGMLIATFCLLQLLVGAMMDRKYDPHVMKYYPYAVFYPIIYWMLMSLTTVISMTALFRKPAKQVTVRWDTARSGKMA